MIMIIVIIIIIISITVWNPLLLRLINPIYIYIYIYIYTYKNNVPSWLSTPPGYERLSLLSTLFHWYQQYVTGHHAPKRKS